MPVYWYRVPLDRDQELILLAGEGRRKQIFLLLLNRREAINTSLHAIATGRAAHSRTRFSAPASPRGARRPAG